MPVRALYIISKGTGAHILIKYDSTLRRSYRSNILAGSVYNVTFETRFAAQTGPVEAGTVQVR